MICQLAFGAVIICIAFTIGFAIRRASICAVAAARQSAHGGRHTRLRAFATAACWSGVVLLPLASLAPQIAVLSPGYAITFMAIAGGAMFGLGAYVNGACAFGTLSHLAGGETNYLGTLVGIFIGAALAAMLPFHPDTPAPSTLTLSSVAGVLLLLAFAGMAATGLRNHLGRRRRRNHGRRAPRRLGASTALLIIGIGGALLHATAGEWTYMAVLSDRAASLVSQDPSDTNLTVFAGSGALIAGGVFAAYRSGRIRWRRPASRKFAIRIIGGAMMGIAAAIVPGGNDVMLLYGVPSAAPHAIAAYITMMVVLYGVFRMKGIRSNAAAARTGNSRRSRGKPVAKRAPGEAVR